MDSQAPNEVAYEWILATVKPELIRREKSYGKSRFDLYIEKGDRKCYIEVKGVTRDRKNNAIGLPGCSGNLVSINTILVAGREK